MNMRRTAALAAALMSASATWSVAAVMESQTFDSEAGAAAAGWTGLNNTTPPGPQDYGWRSSVNAGGAAGEAGGNFTDGDNVVSYYADLTLNGTLTGQQLDASGKLGLISGASDRAETFLGHFDASQPGNVRLVGLALFDGSAGIIRAGARVHYSSGGSDAGNLLNLPTGRTYTFSYTYNPDPDNNPITTSGNLTVTLTDNLANNYVSSVTTAAVLAGAGFNAFGLRTLALTPDGQSHPPITYFADDLSYTVVPEPAGAATLLPALLACAARRGRRRDANASL
jgi:hypothetical protein